MEVKIHKGGEWYVYIYDDNRIIKKFYKGLNKAETDEERELKAKALKLAIENEIKSGWKPRQTKALPSPYLRYITLEEAYETAMGLIKKSDLSEATIREYTSHYKFFMQSAKRLKWHRSQMRDIEQYHIVMIIEEMMNATKKDFKPNAFFNKHLGVVKSFFSILKNKFIWKENIALGIPERKHQPKAKNLLTANQQTLIIERFQETCPQFILYLKVLYHLGIRPKEIRLIRCAMIDQERWIFNLPKEITKNDKNGIVIIPEDIKSDLLNLDLSNPDWYLFGNAKQRSWNKTNQYLPSPYPMATSCSTRLWKAIVKDELKIDSDLYHLKSKGGNDKLRNGMPFDVVSKIMRHSSHSITEAYTTESNLINQELNIEKFGKFN